MEVVSFDLAVKLKEKGYSQEPKNRCQYYEWDGLRKIHPLYTEMVWYESENKKYLYSAPTISQVLKWLREEKKIHIIVEIADSGWYYTIYPNIRWEDGKLKSDKYIMSFKNKSSFELAALAGISWTLDNLI